MSSVQASTDRARMLPRRAVLRSLALTPLLASVPQRAFGQSASPEASPGASPAASPAATIPGITQSAFGTPQGAA
ncbi:MAG: hypothetical protein WBA46_17660, partial [Thermomicrobiales bacterium]